MLDPSRKLALFMEGALSGTSGKMGLGLLRYSPNPIACVIDSQHAGRNAAAVTGISRSCPVVAGLPEAVACGGEVLVLGIAPSGGRIPDAWYETIDQAVTAGLCIVNGLHDRLAPRYASLRPEQWVWDIRVEPRGLSIGTGAAAGLSNRRVLLAGTDMAIGKMSCALEMHKVALARGIRSAFVATGQIGITIAGRGVPLDAVRLDYASGCIEREVMHARDAEIVFVEGQGSLIHPASTANLPLLRGSMPTHVVLCHRAGQRHLVGNPKVAIPPLLELARLYEDLGAACGTFPRPRTAALALNTFHIKSDAEARAATQVLEDETGLPCADPVRHGGDRLLDAVLDLSR